MNQSASLNIVGGNIKGGGGSRIETKQENVACLAGVGPIARKTGNDFPRDWHIA